MAKMSAFGTWLTYVDPDTSGVTRIHYVADISGPEMSMETVDVTTHDSPEQFAEFVAGQADGGELSFDLMFDGSSTNHARLRELLDERANLEFKLVLPQANVERMANPLLTSGTGWSATGDWGISAGIANYSANNPDGTDSLSATPGALVVGETYTVTIVFSAVGENAGLTVQYNSEVIGEVDPEAGGTQSFTFVAAYDSGVLELLYLASIGDYSAHVTSVSVIGPAPRTGGFWEFDGTLTKCGMAFPVKDALKASVAIKVSGKPEFTA